MNADDIPWGLIAKCYHNLRGKPSNTRTGFQLQAEYARLSKSKTIVNCDSKVFSFPVAGIRFSSKSRLAEAQVLKALVLTGSRKRREKGARARVLLTDEAGNPVKRKRGRPRKDETFLQVLLQKPIKATNHKKFRGEFQPPRDFVRDAATNDPGRSPLKQAQKVRDSATLKLATADEIPGPENPVPELRDAITC
ncbi:hypothetical protein HDU93_004404, partial [Gonapodya sp. JEL0774]